MNLNFSDFSPFTQQVPRNRLPYVVTVFSYLLLLSICRYGILQVHCNEVPPMKLCFHGQTFEEVCHKANRRCVEGSDFPNTTTTTTTSTTEATTTTSSSVPPLDGTTVTINFKYKCRDPSTVSCKGMFIITSSFLFSDGMNRYTYLCDDILRTPPGTNSYAKGLRLSTILWRILINEPIMDTPPDEATLQWLQCPNVTAAIHNIVELEPYPLPPQPLQYSCWCFANDDPICMEYLNKMGPVHGGCYQRDDARCYQLLCSDAFGNFISQLTNVDESV
jgi:hypothetical protein